MDAKTPSDAVADDWKALYHEAFRRYRTFCLWNIRESDDPSPAIALSAARHLRYEGDMEARRLAEQIERAVHAAH